VSSMMRPSCCWTFAPTRLLSAVVELPPTVICCPTKVRRLSPAAVPVSGQALTPA
jgi:hypothetical protein